MVLIRAILALPLGKVLCPHCLIPQSHWEKIKKERSRYLTAIDPLQGSMPWKKCLAQGPCCCNRDSNWEISLIWVHKRISLSNDTSDHVNSVILCAFPLMQLFFSSHTEECCWAAAVWQSVPGPPAEGHLSPVHLPEPGWPHRGRIPGPPRRWCAGGSVCCLQRNSKRSFLSKA